jgi:DNA (cytosine-5)-methyltransferase 1
LFTGIGGFDLAARNCGIENVFQVEIDSFCQKVLEKNFPGVKRYSDIKEFNGKEYRGQIDIISGGFPCQPFSVAGKRKGKEDERAIFPEMLRVISEVRPKWVVAENVYGIINIDDGKYFNDILTQLEGEDYEVQSFIIPASAVNAPHQRYRVWIVANSKNNRNGRWKNQQSGNGERQILSEKLRGGEVGSENKRCDREFIADSDDTQTARQRGNGREILSKSESKRLNRSNWERDWYEVATEFCRVDDGVSNRVDRLKSLGNAIVPQIAEIIFKIIIEVENEVHNRI